MFRKLETSLNLKVMNEKENVSITKGSQGSQGQPLLLRSYTGHVV